MTHLLSNENVSKQAQLRSKQTVLTQNLFKEKPFWTIVAHYSNQKLVMGCVVLTEHTKYLVNVFCK